jgi:hypothetical protein
MSHFDDLQRSYSKWRTAQREYHHSSVRFVDGFARRYQAYLGAPETFVDADSGTRIKYVTTLVAEKDNDGEFVLKKATSPFDRLYYDEDSFWVTGVGLTLDINTNAYPKTQFTYLLRFILRAQELEVQVGPERKSFSVKLTDTNELSPDWESVKPVFQYMVDVLKAALAIKLWEPKEKSSIGYIEFK